MSNNAPKLPDILDAFHQEHWYLTKILILLIIIAIASVGSLSLAQHMLPQGPLVATTPAPTYTDGVCDADPTQLQSQYVALPSDQSGSASASGSPTLSSASPTPSNKPSTTPTPISNKKPGTAFGDSASSSTNVEMAFLSSANSQAPSKKPTPPPPTPTPTPTPPPPTPTPTPSVPSNWSTYGYTDQDAKYAEACAAQFVIDYHSFNYIDPSTYTTITPMLSAQAKKLFAQGGADDTHHIHLHMLSTWQNTMAAQKQNEQVTVQQPTISNITPQYSKYIVQVDVGYKLLKSINTLVQQPEIHHDTVILQNTSPSPKLLPNEQTGWQVVDWIDEDV